MGRATTIFEHGQKPDAAVDDSSSCARIFHGFVMLFRAVETKYRRPSHRIARLVLLVVSNRTIKIKTNKKKITNKSLTKPPQLKLFTCSPQAQAYQAMSLPNPSSLYFGLKPINCLSRDSFDCKSIPSCNCPGEDKKILELRTGQNKTFINSSGHITIMYEV